MRNIIAECTIVLENYFFCGNYANSAGYKNKVFRIVKFGLSDIYIEADYPFDVVLDYNIFH